MNKIIITTIIFIAVIFNSIFTTFYSNEKFNKFYNDLNRIMTSINCNSWQTAENQIKKLSLNFENHEKKLQLFLNRNNLEKIQKSLNKLKILINFQNKLNSIIQIKNLQKKFKKIIEDEKPLIHNIL